MKLLFLLFIIISTSVQAEDNIKEVCSILKEQSSQTTFSAQYKIIKQLLGAVLFPERLSPPQEDSIKVSDENKVTHWNPKVKLKNVIFYAGSTPSTLTKISPQSAQEAIDKINNELKPLQKKLREMSKRSNVSDCIDEAKLNGFSVGKFVELSQKKESLIKENQVISNLQSLRMILKAQESTMMDWEIRPFTFNSHLIHALRQDDISNIIIVTHATSDGKLLDSEFNELPSSMFTQLSPSLYSLSVYSCHESAVRKFYKMKESLLNQPSIYGTRKLFTPVMSDFLGSKDTAPLIGFGGFLKKVDKKLSTNPPSQISSAPRWAQVNQCSFKFQDATTKFKVISGSYSFALNGQLIGIIDTGVRSPVLYFPCDILKNDGENVLVNQDLGTVQKSIVEGHMFNANLKIKNNEVIEIQGKQFYRKEDSSYRSTKFKF